MKPNAIQFEPSHYYQNPLMRITVTITVSEFGEEPYGNTLLGYTVYTHIFEFDA